MNQNQPFNLGVANPDYFHEHSN
uniref:Uncharacterized protein n=1 Tax=Arundo donax TaxID=35708 RepID=A0A0A9AJB1_ARUDO